MAPNPESVSVKTYGNTTNSPLAKPAGAVAGETFIVSMFVFDGGTNPDNDVAITMPDGFTLELTVQTLTPERSRHLIYRKVFGFDEPDEYLWAHSARPTALEGVRVSSADADVISDVPPTVNQGTGPNRVWTGLTTETDDCLLLLFGTDYGNTTNDLTPPPGTSELVDGVIQVAYAGLVPVAGTVVADKSHTNNGSPWTAIMWPLRAQAAPAYDYDTLTTGAGPAADSLGGDISSTPVANRLARSTGEVSDFLEESGLWPETVPREIADPGGSIYRCVALRNNEPVKSIPLSAYVVRQYPTQLVLAIGFAPELPGAPTEVIPDELTAPAGVVFSSPLDEESGLDVVSVPPGEWQALWLRLTVPEGALSDLDGKAWAFRFFAPPEA